MTITELSEQLSLVDSLPRFDEYLRTNFSEIRPLFYGLTRSELDTNCYQYESCFEAFLNSTLAKRIQAGAAPTESVLALLILFISLFERAGLYSSVLAVAELLPSGSLQKRAQAIFHYKKITDASTDYILKFDQIMALLHEAHEISEENSKSCCIYLIQEYAINALQECGKIGITSLNKIRSLFLRTSSVGQYPLLAEPSVQAIFTLGAASLQNESTAIRSRIVESLHSEACCYFPEGHVIGEDEDEGSSLPQRYDQLPDFLDEILCSLGANFNPQRSRARTNFSNDADQNKVYLGTYFPRTVTESWNIVSDLMHTPSINDAFAQKDIIRILDIGSGTGAAVVGTLLSLSDWDCRATPVEITSIDFNQDALDRQSALLQMVKDHLRFDFSASQQCVQLPFDLDGFVENLSSFAYDKECRFDLITGWKCLSEFYNVNFAQAQGIVRNALKIISGMLTPFGVCIAADVTTSDNGYEYFAMTLNRESNEHDALAAAMRTIVPMPCAKNSVTCQNPKCYTQRKFMVNHRLVNNDFTKIIYRVFAPSVFAERIVADYADSHAYRNNAARPSEACCGQGKKEFDSSHPCGFTEFLRG